MMATYETLRPIFQILTHFTEQLEQGMSPHSVMQVMTDTLEKSPIPEEISELLQPIRILTGARTSSIPPANAPAEDLLVGVGDTEAANDEVKYEHIVQILELTGARIRSFTRADDYDAIVSLDGLVNRWMILKITTPAQFPAAKLFESEPPSRPTSQRAVRRSLINSAAFISLARSIIDHMSEQAGLFVFDPLQINPAQALTLMHVNEAVIRTSGIAGDALTGSAGFFDKIHPDDLPQLLQELGEAIKIGDGFAEGVRMKSFRAESDGLKEHTVWLQGDILILLPQEMMAGKRIGFFSISNVRETGEIAE